MKDDKEIILFNNDVRKLIFLIRGEQVIFDKDIALLSGVETKRINESVKRNKDRFSPSFAFQLTKEEVEILRSKNATSIKI